MKNEKQTIIKISEDQASKTNGGIFEGWGSSLCWWANRVGYSDVLAQKAAELFYGKEGLGLNIMRYNIGGGDDPSHNHITRTDSEVPGWLVWNEANHQYVYDYQADKDQLNVLRRCYEQAGADAYVEAFSNSAPYFMTISGCASGGIDPNEDNLKPECYEEFAEYLAHVSAYINNELGIRVKSIASMNEPNSDYWPAYNWKQEGCHFHPGESQSKMLLATAEAFRKAGLEHVEVTASDETNTQRQLESCQAFSEEAWDAIDRISTHTYDVPKIHELAEYVAQKGYNLWMSEVDGTYTIGDATDGMAPALGYAQKIIDDINALSPSAWVMWQLIDHHVSKDGYRGKQDSGMPDILDGFWGVAVADHDKQEVILSKKYYAFGQFSRHIKPGSQLIHCGEHSLAAYDKDADTLSVVVVNAEKEPLPITIDVTEFCKNPMSVQTIRTSGNMDEGENWKMVEESLSEDGIFRGDLMGYSVTTYVFKHQI